MTNQTEQTFELTEDFALNARKTVSIEPVAEYEQDGETLTDANVTFETVQAVIERYSAGEGEEQRNGFAIQHGESAIVSDTERGCVAAFVKELNGSPLKPATKARAGFKVTIVEKWAGLGNSSEEENRELDADEKQRLEELGKALADGIATEHAAKAEQRNAAFEAGNALHEAKAILTAEKDGKRPSDRDWGMFLETYAPEWKKKAKNAVSEHMTLAAYPADAYWCFAPEEKNSAKSLTAWHRKNRSNLAAHVAEFVMQKLVTNKFEAKAKKAFAEGGEAKLKEIAVATVDGDTFKEAAQERLTELSNVWAVLVEKGTATVEQFNAMNAEGQAATLNNITAAHVSYEDLTGNLRTCVVAELASIVNRKTDEQIVAEQVQETKETLPTVQRGFVNFTQQEAAEHIAQIMASREDCFELLDMVEEALGSIMDKREAADEVADEADQEADEQSVG